MRVVILQSNYLPWKGYFDLIHDADLFVFYDDLQYTKNDWRNRNRIKTPRGLDWLTIPVGKDAHRLINEVALPADRAWAARHWRALEENYRAAPFFDRYAGFFCDLYRQMPWGRLSELNQYLIKTIARDFLGVKTAFDDSARFGLKGVKQERLVELLKAVGAKTYLSGPSAMNYLEPGRLEQEGIALEWKSYDGYPEYPQFYPPFEHAVSIVDLLFHRGPEAADYIWGARKAAV